MNKDKKLKPFIKWPGGKTKELCHIIPNIPSSINNFYEPFVGGGAVYFSVKASRYFINDKSTDLVKLYNYVRAEDNYDFILALKDIDLSWVSIEDFFYDNQTTLVDFFYEIRIDNMSSHDLKLKIQNWINLKKKTIGIIIPPSLFICPDVFENEILKNVFRKLLRMRALELKKNELSDKDIFLNILTALKSSVYMYYRYLLNNSSDLNIPLHTKISVYYYIRNFSYSSMFRYNSKGHFNVPYGGMGYNKNRLSNKIDYLKSLDLKLRLSNTVIENKDFYEFISNKKIKDDDFIFLDPPYDTTFSTYDNNRFGKNDQKRLSDILVNNINCKWMLVIKNTEFIYNLYDKPNIYINSFDKRYAVSFMNRNIKEVEHLMITNYDLM